MTTPHTRTHQTTRSTPSHLHTLSHTATGGHAAAHTLTSPRTGLTGPGMAASQFGVHTSVTGGGPSGPARGLFPPPPPYYLHYTHDNLQLHAEKQRLASEGHETATQADPLPLPPLDPPPPLTEPYEILSTTFQPTYVRPTLASAGIPTLTSSPPLPRPLEIRKLVLSAVFQHARLLEALANDPESPAAAHAVDQLQAILVNAMHVLGEYREHQALETLRLAMEKTVWETRHVCEQLNKTEAASRDVVRQVLSAPADEGVGGAKERVAIKEAETVVERLRQQGENGEQPEAGSVRAAEVPWWAKDGKERSLWDAVKSI